LYIVDLSIIILHCASPAFINNVHAHFSIACQHDGTLKPIPDCFPSCCHLLCFVSFRATI